LIGELLKRYQDEALERIEFKNCSPQLKSLVSLVVDYSLGGFLENGSETAAPQPTGKPRSVRKIAARKKHAKSAKS